MDFAGKTVISTMNMGILLQAVKSNEKLFNEATTLFGSLNAMMKELSLV